MNTNDLYIEDLKGKSFILENKNGLIIKGGQ